jgi:hypothetical protein
MGLLRAVRDMHRFQRAGPEIGDEQDRPGRLDGDVAREPLGPDRPDERRSTGPAQRSRRRL